MAKSLNWARSNERQRMRQHGAVSIAGEREEELRRILPRRRYVPPHLRQRPSKAALREQAERAFAEWARRPARPSKPRPPSSGERPPWE
jgi:hypothetical protein